MPEPTSITVSYNRKVQLEQFEPVQYGVEVDVALEEGDTVDEVYEEFTELAEDAVEQELARRVAAKKLEDDESE